MSSMLELEADGQTYIDRWTPRLAEPLERELERGLLEQGLLERIPAGEPVCTGRAY